MMDVDSTIASAPTTDSTTTKTDTAVQNALND